MKFPFLLRSPLTTDEYFYGLFLKEQEGVVFIFKLRGNQLNVVTQQKFAYSSGWENILNDIDEVMTQLEEETKRTIHSAIFFVYSHVIDANAKAIKHPYVKYMKELVKNLELKPMGYIECMEGVVEYLKKKEGTSLSAVLIELDKTQLSICVYKGGNAVFFESVARGTDLVKDLLTVFEKIKGTVLLPSRIILYNSSDLDDEATRILSHRWDQDLFIQLPRVEVIREVELFQGLQHVFQEQIGERKEASKKDLPQQKEEKKEVLGFVLGEDIEIKHPRTETKRVTLSLSSIINPLKNRIPSFTFMKPLRFRFSLIGALLIGISVFLLEYSFHKARITVFVPAKSFHKTIPFSTTPIADTHQFEVIEATYSAEFRQSKPATGQREIGEKAQGSVIINNFDSREKVFPKGTRLETDSIRFTLNQEVKVASPTVSLQGTGFIQKPGTAKADVSASEIGPRGNIDKGKQLTIEDFPSLTYFAVSDTVFSGGSKKTVQTVSKQDIEELRNSVLEKAKEEHQKKITTLLKSDEAILSQLTATVLRQPVFSKEIGEEAQEIELRTQVVTIYYLINNDKVRETMKVSLARDVEVGFEIDSILYSVKGAKKEKNVISAVFEVDAKEAKQIDRDKMFKSLIGKQKENVEEMLKKEYGIVGFELDVDSPLPFFGNRMPFFGKNIDLKLSSL